jgi:hypothetical protein
MGFSGQGNITTVKQQSAARRPVTRLITDKEIAIF